MQHAAKAWNFGPQTHEAATVREVVGMAQAAFGQGQVQWGDGKEGPHEAGLVDVGHLVGEIAAGRAIRLSIKRRHWYDDALVP